MKVLPSLLIGVGIALAPLVWQLSDRMLRQNLEAPVANAGTSAALLARIEGLEARLVALESRPIAPPPDDGRLPVIEQEAPDSDTLQDSFSQVVLIADRRSVNDGLAHASSSFLKEFLGLPRPDLSDECQPATNAKLKALLATERVGPIRARLLRPALVSLRQVFRNIEIFEPELYRRIKSSGSLCVRRVRGSTSSASAHAYGLAIDINIDGVLDGLADGKTQLGLILLADYFRKEGWIWGAGFSREDSMHFEVSRGKLEQWRRQGVI